MNDDLATLVLEKFTLPLVNLGFEIVGDPLGTSRFIAEQLRTTSAYQLEAASSEVAMTTDRTKAGRLLFPEPKRAIEVIRSHPMTDPRNRTAPAARRSASRSLDPPFVTQARKFVLECDADPERRRMADKLQPGRYIACLTTVEKADQGIFDRREGDSPISEDRAELVRRTMAEYAEATKRNGRSNLEGR